MTRVIHLLDYSEEVLVCVGTCTCVDGILPSDTYTRERLIAKGNRETVRQTEMTKTRVQMINSSLMRKKKTVKGPCIKRDIGLS